MSGGIGGERRGREEPGASGSARAPRARARPGAFAPLALRALLPLALFALLPFALPPAAAAARGPDAVRVADGSALHVRLVGSVPAQDTTLTEPLETVRLEFSDAVNASLAELRIRGPGIDGEAGVLTPRSARGDPRVIVATPPALEAGRYVLAWRIVSADGHPVSGEIAFRVAPAAAEVGAEGRPPAPGEAREPAAPGDTTRPDAGEAASGERDADEAAASAEAVRPGAAALLRGIAVGLLLALAGLLAFQAWIAPEPSRRVRRAIAVLAVLAPFALAGHLVAWLLYLAPAGRGFDLTWIGFGLTTETGRWELVRTGAAFFALWAATGRARRPGLAAALVGGAVLASGAVGHAAASDTVWAVPVKSVHLAAVALWLGGLLWIVLAEKDLEGLRRGLRRVASVSLIALVVVAATGVAQVYDLLGAPGELVATAYGRLALVKAGGLGLLALFGARNRFLLLPAALERGEAGALRRSVRWEAAVMVAVLLVAGFLAYVPPPGL